MRTSRPQGIDRETAGQLLDGASGMGSGELTRVLAAATAPGHQAELTREETVLAAFQAHHHGAGRAARSGKPLKSPRPRPWLLTPRALAAAAAALATGGVALAASIGALTGHSPAPASSDASQNHRPAQTVPASQPTTAARQTATASPSASRTTPGPATPASVAALCHDLASLGGATGAASPVTVVQALASPVTSQALGRPVFSPLTAITGETAAVPDYCALVLALPRLPQPALAGSLPPAVLARLLSRLTPSALGTVLVTLPSRSLAHVLSGLRPAVQSRILGELPTSVLSQLAPSALATLPPSVLAKLPVPVLAKLPASVLATLPPSVLAKLPTSVLAKLPASVLARLPASVLASLPPAIRAELPAALQARLPLG
jgi:hypothetical protein